MDNQIIGGKVFERRTALGLTQRELAEKISVSDKTVSKWERGLGSPDISLLIPLSKALEISVFELLTGKEPEKEVEEVLKTTIEKSNESTKKIKKKATIFFLTFLIFFILIGICFCVAKTKNIHYINNTITSSVCIDSDCIEVKTIKYNVPKKSYNYNSKQIENGDLVSVDNYKSYKTVRKEIEKILKRDYIAISCNGKNYYYNEKNDYTLIKYTITKKIMVNRITYDFYYGNYCQ